MTTKHTSGPWSVVEHDHAICVQTESPKKTKFGASRYAAIGGFDRGDQAQLEEARANARLIAAAPEMLLALKTIARKTWHRGTAMLHEEEMILVTQAIARATGESE